MLCDEDIGGRKSEKAKELGLAFLYLYYSRYLNFFHMAITYLSYFSLYRTKFLTEDGLFDMIRASKPSKATSQEECKKPLNKAVAVAPQTKSAPKAEAKGKLNKHMPRFYGFILLGLCF